MQEIERFKQTILTEYPRLGEDDTISFRCGADLACFNHCCADVNIFLTPYDVLRLRRALRMGSSQFLSQYTIVPFDKNQKLPVPLLTMKDTMGKECPFVDPEKGCTVYADRPWPCRMYPMGIASPNEKIQTGESRFFFILQEDICLGLKEDRRLTVHEWMDEQGVSEYDEFGELFKQVTLNEKFSQGLQLSPQQIDMYWNSLYDLDKFRRFIFETSFLNRFELPDEEIESIKGNDEALLRFGFKWVEMALFKKETIPIKPEVKKQVQQAQAGACG